ncbi:MAG TPA: hypothetical protein VER11_13060 [Polyangiaceae bacterium]|nr:hypothetical protein [Polyangiaceae bacterium]
MSVNAISNSGAVDLYSNTSSLTPDGLLIYCQSALGSLDSDVKSLLDEQTLNLARKSAISNCENVMKKYADVPNNRAEWEEYDKAFHDSIASLPPGDPVRDQLQAKWDQAWPKQGAFTKEEWSGFTGEIHSILDNVNGNAEINMIQLQSLMSQRQTAVNLSTNLMQKFDEGTKAIVNNMGR